MYVWTPFCVDQMFVVPGLDQEGGGTTAIVHLQDAVNHNLTTATAIEHAFRRLMRMRIRLGMFDPPSLMKYNKLGRVNLRTQASTALTRRASSNSPTVVCFCVLSACCLLGYLFAADTRARAHARDVYFELCPPLTHSFADLAFSGGV